ncbi:MAG: DinB family protein [Candidatus Planktophila sp.]|nr:DinB family protein [Candidatus Planktophila sp.]
MSNPLVERSFKHMAWANAQMFRILKGLPDEAINFSAWNPDWTVGKIAHHIVIAEGRLISRITNQPAPVENDAPTTAVAIEELISICADRDAQLLSLINTPDEMRTFVRYGNEVEFLTSTILVQAVHHASEHRAQISDILAANNMDVLNLDEIDLWSFENWEKSR